MERLQPPGWARPRGYANGIAASGRLVFVAGQVGWDETETFRTRDFVGQVRQALLNTLAVLAEAGAGPEHIVRMTWYITDREEYLSNLEGMGRVYREVMGKHFPAMSMVQVAALIEEEAKVEVETTAVIPEED
ncbi:Endoribonuclease L-PSP [Rubrobacter xylanophilus DSM 9941]|uniref:Endoribonuclease L-PSP n=1 Tax=Rubrobacter xylanophilus (strain DSM 9941 / JCM 11954 / NBRC 16129 / PRD-1) TaxID=266117 RepID=Q1ATR8_RUBXD|nr:RidA family protein [Rubrobacter xylanophilus]ABG05210.1 Endoribonuclease L-PSP [Rubrobacter xylanophilus DSM 9941]